MAGRVDERLTVGHLVAFHLQNAYLAYRKRED